MKTRYLGPQNVRRQDVNGDGRRDLVVELRIAKLELGETDSVADVLGLDAGPRAVRRLGLDRVAMTRRLRAHAVVDDDGAA